LGIWKKVNTRKPTGTTTGITGTSLAPQAHQRHIMDDNLYPYLTFEGRSDTYYWFVVLLNLDMQSMKWEYEENKILENPQAPPQESKARHWHHRHTTGTSCMINSAIIRPLKAIQILDV
jgi:hypothetical protein